MNLKWMKKYVELELDFIGQICKARPTLYWPRMDMETSEIVSICLMCLQLRQGNTRFNYCA